MSESGGESFVEHGDPGAHAEVPERGKSHVTRAASWTRPPGRVLFRDVAHLPPFGRPLRADLVHRRNGYAARFSLIFRTFWRA